MNFKQTTPRSAKYLAWIRTQPCCVCGTTYGIHAHHSATGAMSLKCSDYLAVPLCFTHHNELDNKRKDAIPNLKQIINRLRAEYKGDTV